MERNCLCTRFDNFTSAVRHPWQDQAAPWPEPENRGATPRPLLHLHTLWPPQPARDAAEGGKLLLFLPPGDQEHLLSFFFHFHLSPSSLARWCSSRSTSWTWASSPLTSAGRRCWDFRRQSLPRLAFTTSFIPRILLMLRQHIKNVSLLQIVHLPENVECWCGSSSTKMSKWAPRS